MSDLKNIFAGVNFEWNDALLGNGGAIYLGSSNTNVVFKFSTFKFNTAVSGASIYAVKFNKISMIGCNITLNTAVESGSIYLQQENVVEINSSTCSSNIALSGSGGLLYSANRNQIVARELVLLQNR